MEYERLAVLQEAVGRLLARTAVDLTKVEQLADQPERWQPVPINRWPMLRNSSNSHGLINTDTQV